MRKSNTEGNKIIWRDMERGQSFTFKEKVRSLLYKKIDGYIFHKYMHIYCVYRISGKGCNRKNVTRGHL